MDENQTSRVLSYIENGKSEGANLITGGQQVKKESGGYYIAPTIFEGVKNDMKIAKEEIFGPVLCAIDFDGEDQALEIANDTDYGLNAIIWSNDLNKVHKLAKRIKSGKVLVNSMSDGDRKLCYILWNLNILKYEKNIYNIIKYSLMIIFIYTQ